MGGRSAAASIPTHQVKTVFRRAAQQDVEDAAHWYERQGPGLGLEFVDAVAERLESIRANPEAYPVIMGEIRRALLRRFPYGMFYLIEPDRIVVVACFHARLNPRRWAGRK